MKTNERIKQYLAKNQQASGRELADFLGITDRAVRKQLAAMLKKKQLIKKGRPPKVFYRLSFAGTPSVSETLDPKLAAIINAHYLIITPTGEKMTGVKGFAYWCAKTNQPLEKTAKDYVVTLAKYQGFRRLGLKRSNP